MPVIAQTPTTGTIIGRVSDLAGRAIAGAEVIATSDFGTRNTETDTDGAYILPFLRPGEYSLRAEAPGGYNAVIRTDISVHLEERLNVDFTLEPGKIETVTVTGRAPLVDVSSTSSQTNIKYDEFASAVPLGRSFADTLTAAPGVVSGLRTGDGNYAISGASGLENSYLIDGVNITNTGYGSLGAYNLIYGSLGTGVTSEFLDEVQIKTGGFEAEYGQALGGVINTIVKSGTNDFRGSVAWYATPARLRGSGELVELDGGATNLVEHEVHDFALSLGGPIKKDKLFYFISYNPVYTIEDRRAQAIANPAHLPAANNVSVFDESLASGFGGTAANGFGYGINPLAFPSADQNLERRRSANNYAVKFNWQVSAGHLLELTLFGDPGKGTSGPQRDTSPLFADFTSGGGETELTYGSHNQAARWSAVFTPKLLMEAQVGHHKGTFRESPVVDEYGYRDTRSILEYYRGANSYNDPIGGITPLTLTPVAPRVGAVGFITDQIDELTAYTVKFTSILGSHEIRYGVEYDDIEYADTSRNTGPSFNITLPASDPVTGAPDPANNILLPTRGGAQVLVRNGRGADPAVAFDSANVFRVTSTSIGPERPPTKSREYDGFVQDTWTIDPRWTVKAGLRYTQEMIEGAGEFTLPFGSADFTDSRGATSTIFFPGTTTFTPSRYSFTGNWAPRIGAIFDVLGNGRSRAYANWARYYERVPNDLAVRAFSNELGVSQAAFRDRTLQTWAGGPVSISPGPSDVVAGTKLPYEDELSGGYAFEVTPNSALEVRAIYRTQGRVLEDVQTTADEQAQNFSFGVASGYPYDPFGGSPSQPLSSSFPASTVRALELANPGTNRVPKGGLFSFPKPVRRYKSLELIYTKRFSGHWSLYSNFRLARLEGNYEGLYRNDNRQSDPNLLSLYDFPDSPMMSGQNSSGPLPTDVSRVLHIYPSYQFAHKLRVGASFTWSTGVPRTSMLAHPSAGEIPGIDPIYAYWNTGGTLTKTNSLPAALADVNAVSNPFHFSYTPVTRGNLGRTPDLATLDLHADYPFQIRDTTLRLAADVFNVLGAQEVILFDDDIETGPITLNPDFMKPIRYQDPRSWRLSARWDF